MSDSKTLELLLELLQNPLLVNNYYLCKYDPGALEELSKEDPRMAECISRLGETVEKAWNHLDSLGFPIDSLTTPLMTTSGMVN